MKKLKFIFVSILLSSTFITCVSNTEELEEQTDIEQESASRTLTSFSSTCDDCESNSTFNFSDDDLVYLQTKSVGLIYEDNTLSKRNCSGTLINNPDGKLLFLTAAHCLSLEMENLELSSPTDEYDRFDDDILSETAQQNLIDVINNTVINNWVVRFEYECTSYSNINSGFTVGGLKLRAFNFKTDFILYEITGAISTENKEKLCLSGWNRNGTASNEQAYAFHHPEGKPKKMGITNGFTTFNDSHTNISTFPDYLDKNNFWYTSFNQGGVNQGSSGSGLINSDEQLVGYLTLGNEDDIINCEIKYVTYGKLSQAWGYSVTNSNSSLRTLKNWIGTSISMERSCFDATIACRDTYKGPSFLSTEIINPFCSQQLFCGRVKLKWTVGENVTYNIYRQIQRGAVLKIASNLSVTTNEYIDEEVRTWEGNSEIKYFLEAVNPCNQVVYGDGNVYDSLYGPRIQTTTYGGLINF